MGFINNLWNGAQQLLKEETPAHKPSAKHRANELEIQHALLVMAADVIRCDKNYTHKTEELLRDFFSKQFNDTNWDKQRTALLAHIDAGTEPHLRMAGEVLKRLATFDSRELVVKFLFEVAAADDFANAREVRTIQRLANYMGVHEKNFRTIRLTFQRSNNPYAVLGLEEDASHEAVKRAYRKLVLQFHPDKHNTSIMEEEEAAEKFRAVQRAYETIVGA